MPANWIEASFRPWMDTDLRNTRYGFQWWMLPLERPGGAEDLGGVPFASGYGGQKLFVIPEYDLVVVFFGCTTGGYDCGIGDSVPEAVMWNYVLNGIRE